MANIPKEEIKKIIVGCGLEIIDVIDAVIEIHGIRGLDLIKLGDKLQDYCIKKNSAPIPTTIENTTLAGDNEPKIINISDYKG